MYINFIIHVCFYCIQRISSNLVAFVIGIGHTVNKPSKLKDEIR